MDLMTLRPQDIAEVHLRHPVTDALLYSQKPDPEHVVHALAEGEPTPPYNGPTVDDLTRPVIIQIHGKDSEVFKKQQAIIANRRMNANQKSGKPEEFDFDKLQFDMRNAIVACIAGWKNLEYNGKELKFSAENAQMLVRELPWLGEQLDVAIGERALFIQPSSRK